MFSSKGGHYRILGVHIPREEVTLNLSGSFTRDSQGYDGLLSSNITQILNVQK